MIVLGPLRGRENDPRSSAARTPTTLLAHMEAPTPLPHTAMPRSIRSHCPGERNHIIRIVILRIQ